MKLVLLSFSFVILLQWTRSLDVINNEVCHGDKCQVAKMTSKERYQRLRSDLESIRLSCGDLCNTNITGSPGKYFDSITKDFNCQALFRNELIDKPSEFATAPVHVPKYLKPEFTYHGRILYKEQHYDNEHDGEGHWLEWTEEMIEDARAAFREDRLIGSYGIPVVKDIAKHLNSEHMNVSGQHVLVLGSQRPWLEAIILEAGAKKITTVDYVKIKCYHPQIKTMVMEELRQQYLSDLYRPQFDSIVSFSSVEHSGLGRYGDMLNPWGDLIAMGRMHCLLKPGHKALVGMPVGPRDTLLFNGCRIYGSLMLSHLFANFEQVHTEMDLKHFSDICQYCYQPLFVVQKN